MSWLLAAFALALGASLLFGSWRLALAGMGVQSLLVAIICGRDLHEETLGAVLLLVDLAFVRALAVPLLLAAVLRRTGPPAHFEVLPANLFHWAVAFALTLAGAAFAARIGPVDDPIETAHLGIASVGVLLGMFVLCCHKTPFGQTIGVLTVENGVLLFESSAPHRVPLGVQAGVTVVFAGFVLLAAGFVRRSASPAEPAAIDGDLL